MKFLMYTRRNVSQSFLWHNSHLKFFTNEKLHKIGFKNSPICTFCKTAVDCIEHMLVSCPVVSHFWDTNHGGLAGFGYRGYVISIECIILGDLENSDVFSSIILVCKMTIYNAMKADEIPHLQQVLNNIRNCYYAERYKAYVYTYIYI